MSSRRGQPDWSVPVSDRISNKLVLHNSLTRQKEEFVAMNGRTITWYNCGPTVYDSSHMGHARSYISFDIIRRVLESYFNYDIFFVQNVTDIDDKIIQRARQRYLFKQYSDNIGQNRQQFLIDINEAINQMKSKLDVETDMEKKNMLTKLITNANEVINKTMDLNAILEHNCISDVLSQWLDRIKGHEVNDNSIFQSLSRKFEDEYNEDMKALNILAPDAITRVSEFIPEIIEYIEVIIKNGFAYESNGSVYFDTNKFNSCDQHFYAKLVPEAFGDSKALAEGEGDLSHVSDKRNVNDFALWKNSKPGEPFWSSQWGNGRPGWHIECSVMASSVIGRQMDIHSGGIDLRFPHHDNEMAQAEAYYNTGKPWINYFLHSGHLTISGCKMSKSLKNFVTIKEALKRNTWRQLRFAFLLHSWKDTLDYSDNTMNDAINFEKFANEFFLTVKDLIRTSDKSIVKWTEKEISLNKKYHDLVNNIDFALCNNIDTQTACKHIKELITATNSYLQECPKSPNITLITNIAGYITSIFNVFGVGSKSHGLGFANESSESSDREAIVMPFLEIIANLRETFRIKAKELANKDLLTICDQLRDDVLPNVGVRLEDCEVGDGLTKTRLKLVDKEILMKEREEKIKAQEFKDKEKERKLKEKLLAESKKEEESKLCPLVMFKTEIDKYSQFDDKGLPTHDNEGKELTKSALRKVSKLYSLQEKKHNLYKQCTKCQAI
ncbi:cysteine--tRNA ligase, cytoplasmic-like [Oppia nitens]|uniref:cysteine--tRNA ligase, cytoplasmic-like n=1 Tax=Oppia nitens TaxID=1686743 RepID=UPI0023DB9F69|nr:cysteine--tRNA ligase, cytoplasmic-like [Oppia nitens]